MYSKKMVTISEMCSRPASVSPIVAQNTENSAALVWIIEPRVLAHPNCFRFERIEPSPS
jgi:hypothetical protein